MMSPNVSGLGGGVGWVGVGWGGVGGCAAVRGGARCCPPWVEARPCALHGGPLNRPRPFLSAPLPATTPLPSSLAPHFPPPLNTPPPPPAGLMTSRAWKLRVFSYVAMPPSLWGGEEGVV
jgi:hypothetical protein